MKKTALLIIAVVGVGSVLVPGGAGAVDLFNTNILAEVNETTSDAWVISDATAADYVITDSTITASNWTDKAWTTASTTNESSYFYSLGRGGLSSSATAHNMTVTDSTIKGSDGGVITVVSNVIGIPRFCVDGGDGMLLKNVTNGVFNKATILGGNGGTIIASAAGKSTANAGSGLTLRGTSTLHATNSIFNGGNGGEIRTPPTTGDAVGGDGIVVDEANSTVILDLSDDTQVIGGNGGSVSVQETTPGIADGGNALLVSGSGKKDVTIKGGTFIGGEAGMVGTNTMQAGKSIYVTGKGEVNLTLEGGNFDDGILIDNTAASTLALKSTFTNDAPLLFQGDTLTITEWTDGQLSDVSISGKTAYYVELAGTNEFSLSGSFIVGGNAHAKFSSGLVVESGGTLDLGSSQAANEASSAYIKTNSTIITSTKGVGMGRLNAGLLTIEDGATWKIKNDTGAKITIGTNLLLATATDINSSVTNLNVILDNPYQGVAGWLGKFVNIGLTNIVNSGLTNKELRAQYYMGDIDEMLAVDNASPLGIAVADMSLIVSSSASSSNILFDLGGLTTTLESGRNAFTNGLIRTTQSAKSVVANQKVYVGVINNRTHSYLNHEGVGYPVAGPSGAAGWDLLRNFSDRAESKMSTDGLRSFSDRVEGRYGYDDVASSMRNAEEGASLAGVRLPESWQIWGEGFGSTAHQDTVDKIAGYDVGTGGAMLGIDKRFNNMMIGIAGGFSQSSVNGNEGNDARIDTLNLIGYLSAYIENAYMDLNVNYAMNNVDTEFNGLRYTGNYDANALGFYVGGGYGIALNDWLMLTPEASFLGTYYSRDSYDEKSAIGLPTKQYDTYDQFSSVGTIGATLTMIRKIDLGSHEVFMQPEVRAHLVHDFNADMDPETYRFLGGATVVETPLIETEDNLFKIGAGIRLSEWNNSSTEVGLDVDGLFADGYNAYMISGKITHRF